MERTTVAGFDDFPVDLRQQVMILEDDLRTERGGG